MSGQLRRLLINAIRTGILACGLAAVLIYLYPGVGLLLRPVKSRSPYCTLWQAIRDTSISVKQYRVAGIIEQKSRLIRRDGRLDLWETPKGPYWLPTGNHRILPVLLAQEERNIYGDSMWGVHRGDIVLDCGAHVGTYTRKALAAGARLVVAIEPTPDAVECLRRNLATEVRAGRVIICPKGVWDRDGNLPLFENGRGGGNSFVNRSPGSKRLAGIPVTRIDSLVEELRLPRVDLIKADIKGATERALIGAASVISRYRPRLALSTEEPPENPKSIAHVLERLRPGYTMRCGPCLVANDEISTDVIFFR